MEEQHVMGLKAPTSKPENNVLAAVLVLNMKQIRRTFRSKYKLTRCRQKRRTIREPVYTEILFRNFLESKTFSLATPHPISTVGPK